MSVFLWSSYSFWGLQSFLLFFHKSPQPPSTVWLWVCVSVWVSCWVEPLWGQHAPVCKHNRVSLVVLGIGACPWDGSLVGLVITWPFPQSLFHPLSLKMNRTVVKRNKILPSLFRAAPQEWVWYLCQRNQFKKSCLRSDFLLAQQTSKTLSL